MKTSYLLKYQKHEILPLQRQISKKILKKLQKRRTPDSLRTPGPSLFKGYIFSQPPENYFVDSVLF